MNTLTNKIYLLSFLLLSFGIDAISQNWSNWHIKHDDHNINISIMNGDPDISQGNYSIKERAGYAYIQLEDGNRGSKNSFLIQFVVEAMEISSDSNSDLVLDRESGIIRFTSDSGNANEGRFSFNPKQSFTNFLDSNGIRMDNERNEDYYRFKLFLANVTKEYTNGVLGQGYSPSLRQLTKLAIHHVTIDYLKGLAATKYKGLELDMVTKFAIHGISLDYIKGLDRLGYGDIDANQLKKFAIHGVSLSYIEGMKEAGYNLDAEMIQKFAIHGVSLSYLQGLKRLGYGDMDHNQIKKFAIHGVSIDYIEDLKNSGYDNLDPRTIQNFKIHGVGPKYIESLLSSGINKPDASTIKKARIHGVTAKFIAKARNKGHESKDLSEFIKWKVIGI